VRENRLPGGKPRVKKVRLSSDDNTVHMEPLVVETAVKDGDELTLCQLLEARPDIMPLRESKYI